MNGISDTVCKATYLNWHVAGRLVNKEQVAGVFGQGPTFFVPKL
jgi:hypothetical protein